MVPDLGPSPHCLKASEAESLVFGREEEFFCVQRDENKHQDQELCPVSPCLEGTQSQVGTTPTGCSSGRTATDPQRLDLSWPYLETIHPA